MFAIDLGELAELCHAIELIEEFAALAAAAEAEFADQLFVSGFAAGGALDMAQKFSIGHVFRVGHWRDGRVERMERR